MHLATVLSADNVHHPQTPFKTQFHIFKIYFDLFKESSHFENPTFDFTSPNITKENLYSTARLKLFYLIFVFSKVHVELQICASISSGFTFGFS